MSNDLNRPWLWASEVATLCHVSRATVYRWIRRGEIQVLLQRKPYKIAKSEVKRILAPLP